MVGRSSNRRYDRLREETSCRRSRMRRGVTLMEAVAAITLLSAIAAGLLPLISRTAELRDEAAHHSTAVTETANLMERIAVLRGDGQLDDAQLQELELSDWAAAELSEPELEITIADERDGLPHRRLTVSLSYRNAAGERSAPVVATAFLYGESP